MIICLGKCYIFLGFNIVIKWYYLVLMWLRYRYEFVVNILFKVILKWGI